MKTYSVEFPSQITAVVKELRAEGFRAWGEIESGKEVLCTSADITEIQRYKGFRTATLLHEGLPK